MGDLSLKGIARQYAGKSGSFDVNELFGMFWTWDELSLRERLELLARDERVFKVRDCWKWYGYKYRWKAEFEQTWTHIRVRIKLKPKNDDVEEIINSEGKKSEWKSGFESQWNDKWSAERDGELKCRFTFELDWVDSDQHKKVKVREGPARSNMTKWDTEDDGGTAAHEVGHMLGHEDEYYSADCTDRSNVNSGSIMDNDVLGASMPSRLYSGFASHIGSDVVSQ